MHESDADQRPPRAWWICLIGFVIVAFVAQLPLVLNPGYYSHDELQWGARGDVAVGMIAQVVNWADWHALQYRPLTFSAWMLVSHWLFRSPMAFHAVWVALGIGNGLLLLRLMRRLGIAAAPALLFAFGFTLGPFAAFTHGWVATLADLLWVGAGLALANVLAWCGNDPNRHRSACVAAFALTAVALFAKESAIVLPTLVALAWLLAGRARNLRDAAICSALPVIVYLALRLGVILSTPDATGDYRWSIVSVPRQWLMYQLFPLIPSKTEIITALAISIPHLVLAGAWVTGLAVLVLRADRRVGTLLLLGGTLALGPILLLELPSDQYGYGFAAVTMLALALAWRSMAMAGRTLALGFVIVGIWHGMNIQRQIHHVGELQHRYSPALARAIDSAGVTPVRLLVPANDAGIYRRLSHDLPSYLGVPIGNRVLLVDHGEADYRIESDGRLTPLR